MQLNLYSENRALELASAGKYALLTPAMGVAEESLWRPEERE